MDAWSSSGWTLLDVVTLIARFPRLPPSPLSKRYLSLSLSHNTPVVASCIALLSHAFAFTSTICIFIFTSFGLEPLMDYSIRRTSHARTPSHCLALTSLVLVVYYTYDSPHDSTTSSLLRYHLDLYIPGLRSCNGIMK